MKHNEMDIQAEMDMETRKKLAQGVIMNVKEMIHTGLHGKKVKKLIAAVPVSLLKVDHKSYQREEKKHIVKMSKEWDDSQCTLLLVNYRSDEGWFYVIDGQHRAEAARILGIDYLTCEVFIDLTVEEEARRFLYYNTGTKSLSPFDTFKANICWGEVNDTAIKNVCDKYGIAVIDRKGKAKQLRSVSVVRAIYRNSGISALEWVFSLIEEAHWEDFKESYSADIIQGLGIVYQKYIGELETARRKLIDFMRNSNPTEIMGLANAEYPTYGHVTRVRLVLEEIVRCDGAKEQVKTNRNISIVAS